MHLFGKVLATELETKVCKIVRATLENYTDCVLLSVENPTSTHWQVGEECGLCSIQSMAQFTIQCPSFWKHRPGKEATREHIMLWKHISWAWNSLYSALFPNVFAVSLVSHSPTVAIRRAMVAGDDPLTAFSFPHPARGEKWFEWERTTSELVWVWTSQRGRGSISGWKHTLCKQKPLHSLW